MTNKKSDTEICVCIIVLIAIICVIIALSVLFWYVAVPIIILILYIYYRATEGFPKKEKKVYKVKENYRRSLENVYGKAKKTEKTKNLDVQLEKGKEIHAIVNKKAKFGLIIPYIYGAIQIELIGPKEVRIITQKKEKYITSGERYKVNFKILPEQVGIFTLTVIIYKESQEIKKKSFTLRVETEKFEILIKKSKNFINKSKKLMSKESDKPAVDNWKEAINYFNLAIEKAPTRDEKELKTLRENIYNSYLDFISKNCLKIKEFSLIFQDNKIITKPILGLNAFLSYWLEGNEDNSNLINNISKFLNNFDNYIDYSKKILKFIHDKGRPPEKDEAWDLGIPIDEMDLVLDLINVKITGEVYKRMTFIEKKYYDALSKKLILSKKKMDEFKLEIITTKFNFSLIDAKIVPKFINDLLSLKDISDEIAAYLNVFEISDHQLNKLNQLATKIIKLNISEEKKYSLLDLARRIRASIMETGEALYFLENSEKLAKEEFSKEEIEKYSKKLAEAIKYCLNKKEELNVNLLISRFNLDLITTNDMIAFYGKKFDLPEHLSREETKNLDQISLSVIKYIKEVNETPTIEDLMINLNLNIRNASIIFTFINRISSKPVEEDFEKYPEKVLLEIDDLSCVILKLEKDKQKELDLIDLAYQFDAGIYSIRRALHYISWIENKIDKNYIAQLPVQEKNIIEGKIKAALKYIKENDLKLDFRILIEDVGFKVKDTHLIIGLYNQIISKEINIDAFIEAKKRKIEILSRKIYKAKKSGEISSYEPEEVFMLDIGKASLDDLWEALVYLKVIVLNILMEKSKIVKTELGRISSEGAIQLKERYGIKIGEREDIQLSKETIKLQETRIKFKTAAERVELRRGMDFIGGLIRYKVAIKNNTEMLINNLEVSLQMTAEHIRIIDIKPRVYKKGDRAKIPSMSPTQSESIDFYLEPMICGSIPVSPITTYIDAFGKPQMATRERIMVISKCPPIINPGEENIAKVKNIYESDDIIRSFRSFELEHDPRKSFDLLREAIGAWAGKQVSKPVYESKEPFIAEVYYYVLNQNVDPDLGYREQIIIKIRIDEAKNIAMLNIGAENSPTVNGVLTHIWQLANIRFGETYGYKFESLHCPECGGSLDNMDKKQEFVKCKYCGIEFEKKALK